MRNKARRTTLGTAWNEGARLLNLACEERAIGSNALARAVGLAHAGQQSLWLFGDQRPNRVIAVKLFELFKIPVAAWDQPATEPFVPVASRGAARAEAEPAVA